MRRNPILLCTLIAAAMFAAVTIVSARSEHTGEFDYYLIALSWSPSYCLAHPGEDEQCGSKGFGFVLHGLWPERRHGQSPQHCATSDTPDRATIAHTLAFMPSRSLIEHEWSTHGACSGLGPRDYFGLADRAFAGIAIPPALKAPRSAPALSAQDIVGAFAAVNPGLGHSMLSIECHNGYELSEVRICVDKDTLRPLACSGRVRSTCRSGSLKIPAVR